MADPVIERATADPPGNRNSRMQLTVMALVTGLLLIGVFMTTMNPARKRTLETVSEAAKPTATKPDAVATFSDQARQAEARVAKEMADKAVRDRELALAARGYPAGYTSGDSQRQDPPEDPIKADIKKRAYLARYEPNLALSFREKDADTPRLPPPAHGLNISEREPNEQELPAEKPKLDPARTIYEGTILECLLVNRLVGDYTGPIICQTSVDLWSRDSQHKLIPQGSRVFGETRKVGARNEQRLSVTFHRILTPSGVSMNLDKFTGLDQIGATALKDKVNRHYLSTFGTSLALGSIAGLSLAGTRGIVYGDATDMYRQGVAQEMGQDARRVFERGLQRLPEIEIREGTRVRVYFSQDIEVPDA